MGGVLYAGCWIWVLKPGCWGSRAQVIGFEGTVCIVCELYFFRIYRYRYINDYG